LKLSNKRVREWLEHEGYPLEFQVARKFRDAGFVVRQGTYVKEPGLEAPREIDVIAFRDGHLERYLLRVSYVVECKWSKDKPWVVFTSHHGMATSACVAQSIASDLGSAILWKDAGVKYLQDLDLFETPVRSGFNGRQALSKDGNDRFYNAIRSVVSAAKNVVDEYDDPNRKSGQLPKIATVAFPVIIVQGDLYEAFLDPEDNDLQLKRTPHVRCHWRGSKEWPLHATVDIVTFDHLDKFLETRSSQVETLLRIMEMSLKEIVQCVKSNSIESLQISEGPRGIVGLHPLFQEFVGKQKALKPPETSAPSKSV
jgi:hypothetical protein